MPLTCFVWWITVSSCLFIAQIFGSFDLSSNFDRFSCDSSLFCEFSTIALLRFRLKILFCGDFITFEFRVRCGIGTANVSYNLMRAFRSKSTKDFPGIRWNIEMNCSSNKYAIENHLISLPFQGQWEVPLST